MLLHMKGSKIKILKHTLEEGFEIMVAIMT